MGNTTNKPEHDQSRDSIVVESVTTPTAPLVYKWPDDLYTESREMAAVSFLVYTFAYILSVARTERGLVGLQLTEEGRVKQNPSSASTEQSSGAPTPPSPTSRLNRSFTPGEVLEIIQQNMPTLAESFPKEFAPPAVNILRGTLQGLQERVDTAIGLERPLTLLEFDDKHQDMELVYAVAKDDINQRITLVFRGTENALSSKANDWKSNIAVAKTGVPLPEYLQSKQLGFKSVYLHSGYHAAIFKTTTDKTDDPAKRKYDEILEDIKPLLAANPTYKLYVTGHSLGGALAGMVSFFLACEPDVPKPVTCITFASPRFGDSYYLKAVQVLEQRKKLRYCRVVNDKDLVPFVPTWGFSHGGFQVRLYKQTPDKKDDDDDDDQVPGKGKPTSSATTLPPEISYPKLQDSNQNRWSRTWNNSLFTNTNISYDHADYRERIEQNTTALKDYDLNTMYQDTTLTGF